MSEKEPFKVGRYDLYIVACVQILEGHALSRFHIPGGRTAALPLRF
jgi:hypothetical protein